MKSVVFAGVSFVFIEVQIFCLAASCALNRLPVPALMFGGNKL